jgi:sulfide:quinone oxidoreductase
MQTSSHHKVLIVGGGAAGITTAARLRRAMKGVDVAIVEPSDKHHYQPLFTLVGAGLFPKQVTERDEADYIPKGVAWIRDAVTEFRPEENAVVTRSGARLTYDFLVVAAGLKLDWDRVKGLGEAIGKDGVCSNYSYDYVDTTWANIRAFAGGTAVFTHPATGIKCGGAPQKIMYLADDFFRKAGVRDKTRVVFMSGQPAIFHVPYYVPGLEKVVTRKGIEAHYKYDLVEVRPRAKEAVFRHVETGEERVLRYDMLHVTPPQGPPDFIRTSPLANAEGWVDVDTETTRHVRYPNVFSIGDASSLPTSKTAAAVRKQAPVLVKNLVAAMEGRPPAARYAGYTSCPIVTGYGKLMMCEFDYDRKPVETFPVDQRKERLSMYAIKKWLLPFVYWHGMLKGRL